MKIDYLYQLLELLNSAALDLYLDAFQDKLNPILSKDGRAQDALKKNVGATQ